MSSSEQAAAIAGEILELLQTLPSPRHAAQALCLANVMLIEAQDDTRPTLRTVQECAAEMSVQIIAHWMLRNATIAAQ